jgi:nucleoside-diphosphate-sugar epimerase
VRSFSSLAVISRFELPWAVCDILNVDALASAFAGCEVVVHAALGDPGQIVKMAGTLYAAAERAGIERLIVLSSAAVHGLVPASGSDEQSALHDRHSNDYCNAKVRAEKVLRAARRKGRVELIILRPSIVYGPRCRLFARIAEMLLNQTAFFIENGSGVCNTIYIDNLIDAIVAALKSGADERGIFHINDAENVSWRDVYVRIASAFGIQESEVPNIACPVFRRSVKARIERFVASRYAQSLLPIIPMRLKRFAKVLLRSWEAPSPANAWALPTSPEPQIDEEIAMLQQCRWRFSNARAQCTLGYQPSVTFDEGMRRTVGWMAFAGYPVLNNFDP